MDTVLQLAGMEEAPLVSRDGARDYWTKLLSAGTQEAEIF
jgi:hypothetical protein